MEGNVQTITLGGTEYVIVPRSEYERLTSGRSAEGSVRAARGLDTCEGAREEPWSANVQPEEALVERRSRGEAAGLGAPEKR